MIKLSKREDGFCYWQARGYSSKDSIYKAGYKAKSDLIAQKYAWHLLQKIEIKQTIEQRRLEIFDKNMITDDYVLQNLSEIAKNGEVEANRVRATELLGKYLAMFTERIETKQDITLTQEQQAEATQQARAILSNLSKEN